MLKNVLFVTEPENYPSLDLFVKRSWDKFFGHIVDSMEEAVSLIGKSVDAFSLVVTVVGNDEIEKLGAKPFVLKRMIDKAKIKILTLDKSSFDEQSLKELVVQNLES